MRLAELHTKRDWKQSPIAELFLPWISKILTLSAEELGTTWSKLYVTNRSRPYNPQNLENRIKRLNKNGIDIGELQLGSSEIGLLDFPHANQSNPRLNLIGAIGCGKSSIVHYVFNHVLYYVRGAEKTIPIIINCITLSTDTPNTDLLEKFKTAWEKSPQAGVKLKNVCPSSYENINKLLTLDSIKENEANTILLKVFKILKNFKENGGVPVIVFDNSDNIIGSSIDVIRTAAQKASYEYQLVTILPIRPDTYNTYASARLGRKAFIGYRIWLQRPKLDEVLKARFDQVTVEVLRKLKETEILKSISISDIALLDEKYIVKYMNYLTKKAVSKNMQNFLWRVTNGSLRIALLAIIKMANFNDHAHDAIIEQDPSIRSEEKELKPYELLIKSIMLDSVALYGKQDTDTICFPNLFRVGDSIEISVAHKYWMLCYLDVIGVPVSLSKFEAAGYYIGLSQEAINALLDNGFKQEIFLPTEYDIGETSQVHIAISPRGKLFLESLIGNADYIYQVTTDIHVTKSVIHRANQNDPAWFSVRAMALSHLLSATLNAEERLIAIAQKNKFEIILKRVSEYGLLSKRLYKASKKIRNWALRSDHKSVKDAGNRLLKPLQQHLSNTKKLEKRMREAIVSSDEEVFPLNKKIKVDGGLLELNLRSLGGKNSMPNGIISITGDISNSNTEFLGIFEFEGTGAELSSMGQIFVQHGLSRTCTLPIRLAGEKIGLNNLRINIFADGAPYCDGLVRLIKQKNLQLVNYNTYPLLSSSEGVPPSNCYIRAMYSHKKSEMRYEMFFPNINQDDGGWPILPLDVIQNIDKNEMCDRCKKAIKALNQLGRLEGSFDERRSLVGAIRAKGLSLAKYIMGERVMRRINELLGSHDFVGLSTNLPCIPWEICHLGDYGDAELFPQELGKLWRCYPRGPEKKVLRFNESNPNHLNGVALIVGRDRWRNTQNWDINISSIPPVNRIHSLEEYYSAAENKQRVYLIGHRTDDGIELAQNIFLGHDEVEAFKLPKSSFGIFGTCHASTYHRCHKQPGGTIPTPSDGMPLGFNAAISSRSVLLLPLGKLQSVDIADIIGILENEIERHNNESLWKIWNNCVSLFKTPMWPFFSLCGSWATPIGQ